MTTPGSAAELEARRRRAADYFQERRPLQEIATRHNSACGRVPIQYDVKDENSHSSPFDPSENSVGVFLHDRRSIATKEYPVSVLIQFEYLYRDADNYKKWGEMCFDNPNNRLASSIERDIRSTLIDNTWFVAHQVQIPELFLFEDTTATHADHCYHEFIGIQPCVDDLPREKIEESIERLVARFKAASLKGWSAFNPRRHFM